jgi:hypothetical protein
MPAQLRMPSKCEKSLGISLSIEPLLEEYHREATLARVNFQRQVTIELDELAANTKRLQEELEQEETRVSEHLRQLQSRKSHCSRTSISEN